MTGKLVAMLMALVGVMVAIGGATASYFVVHRETQTGRAVERGANTRPPSAPPALRRLYIPDGALPTTLPLVGSSARSEFGYPLNRPPPEPLRALLRARKFKTLNRYFEAYQKAFEEDFRLEYWPLVAVDAISLPDPELGALIEEWSKAHPKHFAPWMALSSFHSQLAWHYRGRKLASETPEEAFAKFRRHQYRAAEFAEEAGKHRPRLFHAETAAMSAWFYVHEAEQVRKAYDRANTICPQCILAHQIALGHAEPKWGGSFEEMEALATAVQASVDRNPRIRTLLGKADAYRCSQLLIDKHYEEALAACSRALRHGPNATVLATRGVVHHYLKRPELERADLEAALRLVPWHSKALRWLSGLELEERHVEKAADLALRARRVDPTSERNGYRTRSAAVALRAQSVAAEKAGDWYEALRLSQLSVEVYPYLRELRHSNSALRDRLVKSLGGVEGIEPRAAAAPDDFLLQCLLDAALLAEHRTGDVLSLWNRFLATHPDHAGAYNERAGIYVHLGKPEQSYKDAERSCRLGSWEACNYLAYLDSRAGH
ncbi:MAG: DUF4034 domain-containing protein [Myxococcales bacterium]|nr:DUF4034 domain-containing protein [Myxococcales bacterium]